MSLRCFAALRELPRADIAAKRLGRGARQQAHAGRELFLAHRLDHRAQPSLFVRVVAVGCKKVMQKR
jgi:hypothetical protein